MNQLKKLFIKKTLLLFFLFATFGFSQERLNSEKFNTISKSNLITNVVGWEKSIDGDWISNKNVIYGNKLFTNKLKITDDIKYSVAGTNQNLINMFFKKISYKGNFYYCLYIVKWDSGYKYPSIYEGYEYFKSEKIHIFTEEEYKKILNIKENPIIIKSKINLSNRIDPKCKNCEQDYMINYELNKEDKNPLLYYMIVKKSDDGLNIRFQLPTFIGESPIYWKEENLIRDFTKRYFEISISEFSKIIIE